MTYRFILIDVLFFAHTKFSERKIIFKKRGTRQHYAHSIEAAFNNCRLQNQLENSRLPLRCQLTANASQRLRR